MKNEMNLITLWALMSGAMALLSLTYFYLSHELEAYAVPVMGITFIAIAFPYCIWKYKQIRFVEKRSIVIQILQD